MAKPYNKKSSGRNFSRAKGEKGDRLSAKRKKAAINLIIAAIIIIASYFLDTEYYILTDFIENTIINPEPPRVVQTVGTVAKAENELLIHFVDVGQGDCIIIQLPDGKNMIIDGGPRKAVNSVLNFISSYGIKTFDYLVLTHTDEDHVGSLDDVILNTEIKRIYKPDVSEKVITTTVYRNFLTAVNGEGLNSEDIITTVIGSRITSSAGYEIVFFTPSTEMYGQVKSSSAEKINSVSPIMILKYGGKRVMFTGDATKGSEELFLEAAASHSSLKDEVVDVDVLKVAHHGSGTSTTESFLNTVKPEISVISVGADNKYGHPDGNLLSRLAVYSDNILRTDKLGTVTVKLNPDGYGNAEISFSCTKSGTDTAGIVTVSVKSDLLYALFIDRKIFLAAFKAF